jgi:arsenate reductase (thioredoxin)
MNTVLFACVHNAGRSQMAAAWFNLLSDAIKARAISAGTDPGPRAHAAVVTVMNEVGVDLSMATPSKLTPELAQRAQMLITMGCGDECPVVPGLKRDDLACASRVLASPSRFSGCGDTSRRSQPLSRTSSISQ